MCLFWPSYAMAGVDLEPDETGSYGVFTRSGESVRIELHKCQRTELCGRIVWLARPVNPNGSLRLDILNTHPELRDRPLIGLRVLWNLERRKPGVWKGGVLYNADDGKRYRANLEFLDRDTVELTACYLLFCRDQRWSRHESAEAAETDDLVDQRVWNSTF